MKWLAEYNGWSNYQTWLANQYYGEEPDLEYIQETYQESGYDLSQTVDSYAGFIEEMIEMDKPTLEGYAKEKLDNFLKEIDYQEIAQSVIDNCELTKEEE